jgi:hypothetical protein
VPVIVETDDGEATIWVRRADLRNVDFARARAELQAARADDETDAEFVEHMYPLLIARGCVVDWEGFTDDKGEPVPCDEKAVLWLFENTDGVFERVAIVAGDTEAYRLEADTKSH